MRRTKIVCTMGPNTNSRDLKMCIRDSSWRGKEIVNISRAFLDTNGAHQENDVFVEIPKAEDTPLKRSGDIADVKEKWLSTLSDLNACSQKGLVEMFDSSRCV